MGPMAVSKSCGSLYWQKTRPAFSTSLQIQLAAPQHVDLYMLLYVVWEHTPSSLVREDDSVTVSLEGAVES